MLKGALQTLTVTLVAAGVTGVSAAVVLSRANGVYLTATAVSGQVSESDDAQQRPAPPESAEPAPLEPIPEDRIEKTLRNYRIRLGSGGRASGHIRIADPISGATSGLEEVRILFAQGGQVRGSAVAMLDGAFEVSGLTPGVYTLIGAGSGGYVTYGVELLAPEGPVVQGDDGPAIRNAAYQEVAASLEIDSLAIPPRDFSTVARLIRMNVPDELLQGIVPPASQPGEPLNDGLQIVPDAKPTTGLKAHSVLIRDGGTVYGRMRRLHPGTGDRLRIRRLNVYLINNDRVVAQAPVADNGVFAFRNVLPGIHSFVAVGAEGLTAFSINAVDATVAEAPTGDDLSTPVLFQADDETPNLEATLGQPQDMQLQYNNLIALIQGPFGPGPLGIVPQGMGVGAEGFGGGTVGSDRQLLGLIGFGLGTAGLATSLSNNNVNQAIFSPPGP